MSSVTEYVLNNDNVSVCIVALTYQQAMSTADDIVRELIMSDSGAEVVKRYKDYIEFKNGSSIHFVSNNSNAEVSMRARHYKLLLFNVNVYDRHHMYYLVSEKRGILSY